MSRDGSTLAIAAPGELPSSQLSRAVSFLSSQGNVYVASLEDNCTFSAPIPLDKPVLSTPFAQGFGRGLAMTRDGSHLIVGVGGCYVKPGDQAPPCPKFPSTPDWQPEAQPIIPPSDSSKSTGNYSDSGAREYITTEMDVLWVYSRRPGNTTSGPRYELDVAASKGLTLTGPILVNQSAAPELYFYTTPIDVRISASNRARVIAARAHVAFASKASTFSAGELTALQVRCLCATQVVFPMQCLVSCASKLTCSALDLGRHALIVAECCPEGGLGLGGRPMPKGTYRVPLNCADWTPQTMHAGVQEAGNRT
jgi:hypothetical protein